VTNDRPIVVSIRVRIASFAALCAAFAMTACTTCALPWNHWPTATVAYVTRVQDLRSAVEKQCLSSENVRDNVPVAVMSYKIGRIPP
jgi:hypothetical protein